MRNFVIRLFCVLFGIFSLSIALSIGIAGRGKTPPYALIVNTNFRDYDQAIYLIAPDGTPLRRLTRIPGSEQIMAHSQDGQWLIVRSVVNQNYYSIHIPTSRIRFIADGSYRFTSIQPDNSVYMHRYSQHPDQSGLYRIDLKTGDRQLIAPSRSIIYEAHISPDHEWIYFQDPSANLARMARIKPDGSGYENLFAFNISEFIG